MRLPGSSPSRRSSTHLAIEPPTVRADDALVARLAALASASTAHVPVRRAPVRIAAAAAGVLVVVGGGAYAADQLAGPAPARHHVPPAGSPGTGHDRHAGGSGGDDASTGPDEGTPTTGRTPDHTPAAPGTPPPAPAVVPGSTSPDDPEGTHPGHHPHGPAGHGADPASGQQGQEHSQPQGHGQEHEQGHDQGHDQGQHHEHGPGSDTVATDDGPGSGPASGD